jgi:hypothetical protein
MTNPRHIPSQYPDGVHDGEHEAQILAGKFWLVKLRARVLRQLLLIVASYRSM